jgi:hypothetical protein
MDLFLERFLGARCRRVLVANHRHKVEPDNATEYVGSNIGTAGVVTEIFGNLFFAAVPSREPRLDRYLRNRAP